MKKILFSLLMLCCMTAAFAGPGSGSFTDPYSGTWDCTKLGTQLMAGDYLANDCDIRGAVNVTDVMLNKSVYMDGTNWSVGKCLESDMQHVYGEYRSTWNSAEDRKHQMFIVSSTNVRNGNEINIKGSYTGFYLFLSIDIFGPRQPCISHIIQHSHLFFSYDI